MLARNFGALLFVACLPASGVMLDPDGRGQALIFPYYTAHDARGNAFNTLLSIVNHSADAKAVRVTFREGRNAKAVASFNLFLSPNDVWTGAVAATGGGGTRLVTADLSCTEPPFTTDGALLSLPFLTGAQLNDNLPAEPERTREGFVEAIEMATLSGASAAAVAHDSSGRPVNCGGVRAPATVSVTTPTGNLSGTLTLINVASGEDFTLNAEALAGLSRIPFYRAAADPYPDFNVAEIDPVSLVMTPEYVFRSEWRRPVDAVSAALMRSAWRGEVVFDAGTNSSTEFVVTFPTQRFYLEQYGSAGFTDFFGIQPFNDGSCLPPSIKSSGQAVQAVGFDRESRNVTYRDETITSGAIRDRGTFCGAASVWDFVNYPPDGQAIAATKVLGARNRANSTGVNRGPVTESGWWGFSAVPEWGGRPPLASLGTSVRMTIATGESTTGFHLHYGLPVIGFAVRTFENGTLSCSAGFCQGNYGGAFPLKYSRRVDVLPR